MRTEEVRVTNRGRYGRVGRGRETGPVPLASGIVTGSRAGETRGWDDDVSGFGAASPGAPGPVDRSGEGMRPAVKTEPISARKAPRTQTARQVARRAQVVVKRVNPWSVLKFSLLFYFCLMLVFLFAAVIL